MSKADDLRAIGEYDSLTFCQTFIKELMAENYQLSQKIKRYQEVVGLSSKDCTQLLSEDALRAENARLRKALRDIAHGPAGYWNIPEHHAEVIRYMMNAARAALEGVK